MKTFFCGVDFNQLMPHSGDTMVNYSTIRRRNLDTAHISNGLTFVDSGGYTEILKNGKYSYSSDALVDYCDTHRCDYFATLDYPCESLVLQKTGLTVREHVVKTVLSALDLCDHPKCVPVIQGRTVLDYLVCIDLLKDYGCIKPYMAVGSLCKRQKTAEINDILTAVSHELPNVKHHAFGVKLRSLPAISDKIHSSDSIAWFYYQRGGIPVKIPVMRAYSARVRSHYCSGSCVAAC